MIYAGVLLIVAGILAAVSLALLMVGLEIGLRKVIYILTPCVFIASFLVSFVVVHNIMYDWKVKSWEVTHTDMYSCQWVYFNNKHYNITRITNRVVGDDERVIAEEKISGPYGCLCYSTSLNLFTNKPVEFKIVKKRRGIGEDDGS